MTLKRTIIGVVLLLLLAMTWGFFNFWRSPAYYRPASECVFNSAILTMGQYRDIISQHERPFVVATESAVLFGAEHTRDPDDPQLDLIRASWDSLTPTVALVEGRLGFFAPHFMDPVEEYGESGLVSHLARKNNIELYSWELPKPDLVAGLLEIYTPQQVALSQILTPYFSNYRFGKPDDPDAYVAGYLHRAGYPGLENAISSVEDIDRVWARDFADHPDWRETSDQYGLPGYLADMMADANMIRNQHLLCVINDLRARGERVFAVCGSSHAVCLAPALE